mmetsp:Transcript_30101/g.77577  ORF Transcript_30101/g.77577 Transcript_30101/m.77577 type:complete len:235 (+) Transcript_30101:3-707(+)
MALPAGPTPNPRPPRPCSPCPRTAPPGAPAHTALRAPRSPPAARASAPGNLPLPRGRPTQGPTPLDAAGVTGRISPAPQAPVGAAVHEGDVVGSSQRTRHHMPSPRWPCPGPWHVCSAVLRRPAPAPSQGAPAHCAPGPAALDLALRDPVGSNRPQPGKTPESPDAAQAQRVPPCPPQARGVVVFSDQPTPAEGPAVAQRTRMGRHLLGRGLGPHVSPARRGPGGGPGGLAVAQ